MVFLIERLPQMIQKRRSEKGYLTSIPEELCRTSSGGVD